MKNSGDLKWFFKVSFVAFITSIFFSFISNVAINELPIIPSVLILIFVIFVGVIFDIIGVAVNVADEEHFHAQATKKVESAKTSIKLIKNANQVSNVCADVIGDVCGVLSGAIGASISLRIMSFTNIPFNIQYLISALIASTTIGCKAIGKGIARRHSTQIITVFGRILKRFYK